MNISMRFDGYVEKIVDRAVARGIVKTKAEALRLGLLELNDKYGLVAKARQKAEDRADIAEVKRIRRDIKSGKEKVYRGTVKDLFG